MWLREVGVVERGGCGLVKLYMVEWAWPQTASV